jgi:hypothetical protein
MKGVQHLEEDRSRFMFKLDECRQDFLFSAFKSKLRVVEIVIDLGTELPHRIVVLDVLARDERGA